MSQFVTSNFLLSFSRSYTFSTNFVPVRRLVRHSFSVGGSLGVGGSSLCGIAIGTTFYCITGAALVEIKAIPFLSHVYQDMYALCRSCIHMAKNMYTKMAFRIHINSYLPIFS